MSYDQFASRALRRLISQEATERGQLNCIWAGRILGEEFAGCYLAAKMEARVESANDLIDAMEAAGMTTPEHIADLRGRVKTLAKVQDAAKPADTPPPAAYPPPKDPSGSPSS